jgi:hypothetical protein
MNTKAKKLPTSDYLITVVGNDKFCRTIAGEFHSIEGAAKSLPNLLAALGRSTIENFVKITIVALGIILSLGIAQADDRKPRHVRREPNWIIERQTSYQVEGVPTSRLIIGKREIDIYRNGLMFEKGNVVGVKK